MKRLRRVLLLVVVLFALAACGSGNSTASGSASTASIPPPLTATKVASIAPTITNGQATQPTAQSNTGQGGQITVFAAASLTEAFTAIGQRFDAANGSTTTFNFAGSQQLAQQIAQGAPADVFASANVTQMNNLIQAGAIISGTQQTFARNQLVVVFPSGNPAGIASVFDLTKPGVKLVLADKAVPVGQYSLDFLAKASERPEYTSIYSETVLANVVSYEQNVRAVVSKIALGEADAGIVYASDIAQQSADQIGRLPIPDELNTIASYPVAPTVAASAPDLAQQFIEYVLSGEGQAILEQFGFLPAATAAPD